MSVSTMPSPDLFFDTVNAFQRTAALKTAIELDVFTAMADGGATAAEVAARCHASERGTRILCDYLTVIGFLTKADGAYHLTPESAAFLSKRSRAYLGTMIDFLTLPDLKQHFDVLSDTVRRGTLPPADSLVSEENPAWVEFARSMTPLMVPAAHAIAGHLASASGASMKVLDIAASHGIFGITIAEQNPRAEIVAVDWPSVLKVAQENAQQRAVADRFRTIPGDAFTVDFGDGYDAVLITNFLHHFDRPTCTTFLKKVATALKPGGRVVLLEFVPNDDRVSPPIPATFSLIMLAGTAGGDAYTMREFEQMLKDAGFGDLAAYPLPTPQQLLIARKP